MVGSRHWQANIALLLALSMGTGIATLPLMQVPAQAQATRFLDVLPDSWAGNFINELAQRDIINGFPDGTFRPYERVTRAQFAAMVQKAFSRSTVRTAIAFMDVPDRYWAYSSIRRAYATGFMAGYPSGAFYPEQNIPRAQVLVALANGLGYSHQNSVSDTLQLYNDADEIPAYARESIAAATEKGLVVNYPNRPVLNPNRPATRGEVAAFIYQALVSGGHAASITSPYIVAQSTAQSSVSQPQIEAVRIPAGTTLPTRYDRAAMIYVAVEEPDPVPVTLVIDRDLISAAGRVLIPINTQVIGELRSVRNGSQFYARELMMPDGTRLSIDASSQLITTTKEMRQGANGDEIAAGAEMGAGAAAGIAVITGDRRTIAPDEILGGGAVNSLIGFFRGRDRITLISINPNADLDITLTAPLALR